MTLANRPFGPDLRTAIRDNLSNFTQQGAVPVGLRRAAVAVVVVRGEGDLGAFLLTRRTSDLKDHPGQFALPGGVIDSGESPLAAACRECEEEVGLRLEPSDRLGALDPYQTRSGFVIQPFVFWGGDAADLIPNPEEVATLYRVPLGDLFQKEIPVLRPIPESDRPVLSLPICGTQVHAPTAAVIFQFREVALRGLATRVDHFEEPVWAWK